MTGLQNGSAKCTIHITVKYYIFKVLQKSVLCNLLKQTSVLKVSEIQDKYFNFLEASVEKPIHSKITEKNKLL